MARFNKILLVIIAGLIIGANFLTILPRAFAQSANNVGDIINDLDNTAIKSHIINADSGQKPTIYQYVGKIVNFFLMFLGVLFLGIIIYAGIIWMMAKGNAQSVEEAVKWIENSTIGIIIIVAAYLLTNYVVFAILGISIK